MFWAFLIMKSDFRKAACMPPALTVGGGGISFLLNIQEFIRHRLVIGEYEHPGSIN
jgi:hypothetical protein